MRVPSALSVVVQSVLAFSLLGFGFSGQSLDRAGAGQGAPAEPDALRGGRELFSNRAAPATDPSNSADQLLMWVDWRDCAALTDGDLDRWKARGVRGFICDVKWLHDMGGTYLWTGDRTSPLTGPEYAAQRTFRDSNLVSRANQRGMILYFAFWLTNYWNSATPLVEWFDDARWANFAIPRIRGVAAAARLLGFAGIAFDQELYTQRDGRKASWGWNYPQNTHTEAEVRAKVKQRGQEVMRAILQGFPNVEILAYDTLFPETAAESVQRTVNRIDHSYDGYTHINFWDGLSSVEGYAMILHLNALFYKSPHIGSWDGVLQEEYNKFHSLLSRRFTHGAAASLRVLESPFIWINAGPDSKWEYARPPAYVAEQLQVFRKWGQGRILPVYNYGRLGQFDYTPYVAAMRAASTPGMVDSQPPQLTITSPTTESVYTTSSASLSLAGYATDNLAVQVIQWSSDHSSNGAARMVWQAKSGNYQSGWDWQMNWSIEAIPLQVGSNTITVTVKDIKGLSQRRVLTVVRQ